MKIGIFPGSFNPIHIGHLAVANYVAEFTGLDEVWLLISPKNPLKTIPDLLDQELRLDLIEKAIGNYPKVKTCTVEWEMPQPTYTINTLHKLRIMYPENIFYLVMGSDNWDTIHRWKDYQIILNNFKILIYPRLGFGKSLFVHPNGKFIKGAQKIEISSSFIRKSMSEGKDVRLFMPNGVYETLIEKNAFPLITKEEIIIPETPDENIGE
ncbi:MAG: nicotinate-nucleotide adenylyltransferase [Dysgonamonadaceae bacterium]|jgi:nicotinate-nucleotide adenylyltransferase|nr:nicotinate-nucleotide adenylyltransferase [Dysgonamonadaceae bacterium]